MSKDSRIWIYTSDREFTAHELELLHSKLTDFAQSWLSHGDEVKASYNVLHNHFIILAVDENKAKTGGCSIDSSFSLIKKLEQELNITLLNRQILTFMIDTKIIQTPLIEIKSNQKVLENKDSKIFFNNLVENLEQLNNSWLVEPQESWIKNHL